MRPDLCFIILSIIVCSASVVLECGLKAYWVGDIMLWSMRWLISWLFIRVSRSFAIIGNSEIGL